MKNIHVLSTKKPSKLLKDIVDKTYQLKKEVTFGNRIEVPLNIYITSNEEIKEASFAIIEIDNTKELVKVLGIDTINNIYEVELLNINNTKISVFNSEIKKIILTTDQDLIKDGVQAITDEFLEWFVNNPSCEFVEVDLMPYDGTKSISKYWGGEYKIIIPKEEPKQDLEKEMFELEQELDIPSHLRWHNSKPKQETLEEVAKQKYKGEYICNGIDIVPAWREGFIDGAKWQQEQDNNKFSEEEVLPLLEMLQKCKEYFLLKTDAKSEERADTIGQAIEDFNKFKKNKI